MKDDVTPLSAIVLSVTLTLAGEAFAQPANRPAPSPEMQQRLAQAKARLQLTPQQEPKLGALLQEEGQKLRAIQARYGSDDSQPTKRAKGREARAVREDFRAKLRDVLTPAQLDTWDQMAAEARAQARQRRQGH